MKAVVFHEGSRWELAEVATPKPQAGEVLLKVLRTGVCGTDEHLLHGGFIAKLPLIPGHEIVGEVVGLGAGVEGIAVGTRVVVDNAIYCGECASCGRGEPLFCQRFVSLGCNAPGGFAEYVAVRASKAYPIGDLDIDVAVFTEPTACALHGIDVLNLRAASHALIFGAGPTGLLLAQLLQMSGAASVTVAAPTLSKLELAQRYGAHRVVQLKRGEPLASADELRAIAPDGFDAVIEATGVPELLELGVSLTRIGGTVMVYGVAAEQATASIRPYEIFSRELTIKGSFAQANCIGRALFALKSGRIKTEGMITSTVGLSTFDRALANLHDSEHIKTVFSPSAN